MNYFIDKKYAYIDIDEETYNKEENYIKDGLGEKIGIIIYILKHKKGNFFKKIILKLNDKLVIDQEHFDIYMPSII